MSPVPGAERLFRDAALGLAVTPELLARCLGVADVCRAGRHGDRACRHPGGQGVSLIITPNLKDPDAAYAALLAAHNGLNGAESQALNARLVPIQMNHLGDRPEFAEAPETGARYRLEYRLWRLYDAFSTPRSI